MPRDSGGTYTLPAGNPVVSGTTISSTWANNTLADIATALTNSLSRDGDGGMLVPFELSDGVVAAPGLAFTLEPTSGLWRTSAGVVGFSILGTNRLSVSATGLGVTGTVAASGAVSGASLSATAGVSAGTTVAAGTTVSAGSVFLGPIGNAGAPTYSFTADPNTGMFSSGADQLDFAVNGISRLTLDTNGLTCALPYYTALGSSTIPAYSFTGDTNTGMYSPGADQIGWTVGSGTQTLLLTTSALSSTAPLRLAAGSAAAPSYSFTGDPDTGLYSLSANILGFAEGGTAYRVGYREIPRSTTGGTLTAAMVGTCQAVTASVTVNNSVFAAGDSLMVYNNSASTISITKGTITNLRLAGTTTDATLTLAARGFATLWFNSATECVVAGNVS